LAPPWKEAAKVQKELKKVHAQFIEVKAKVLRLRRQKRILQKKLRALGNQEEQNILNLEINKAAAEALKPLAEKQL
jgi:hypothetical protein